VPFLLQGGFWARKQKKKKKMRRQRTGKNRGGRACGSCTSAVSWGFLSVGRLVLSGVLGNTSPGLMGGGKESWGKNQKTTDAPKKAQAWGIKERRESLIGGGCLCGPLPQPKSRGKGTGKVPPIPRFMGVGDLPVGRANDSPKGVFGFLCKIKKLAEEPTSEARKMRAW